ncbi:MAG: hypothetical protein GY940_25875, partial [bacterium]|nr:hypothetical protein [bacterium]
MKRFQSVKFRVNLAKVLFIMLAWMAAGLFFNLIEYLLISPAAGIEDLKDVLPVHIKTYSFARSIGLTLVAALVAGLGIGALEIFYFQVRFRPNPFVYSLLGISLTYTPVITGFLIGGVFIVQST